MTGEELGRRSLEVDAAYCAAAATVTLLARRPLAQILALPTSTVAVPALGTYVWFGILARLARRPSWRSPVGAVAAANLGAAAVLLGLAAKRRQGRILLAATALEVTAFACSQLVALRRPT